MFRLAQLDLEGEYVFESITLKTIEKRIDGFLKRTDGPGPNVFVEFQGWDDPKIYWRSFREVCMFTVLKPLVSSRHDVKDHIQEWKTEVTSLPLPDENIQKIIELLECAVWQKLPNLPLKEVQKMIQLTPLEETVAGKELIQIGERRGIRKGELQSKEKWLIKGEVIGEIRMAQKMLKQSISTKKDLSQKGMNTLRKMLQHIKAEEQEREQK